MLIWKFFMLFDFFIVFFSLKLRKKFQRVIQLPKPNQPKFNWIGLVRIWSKKFMNPTLIKPIKINQFEFIFSSNPNRTNTNLDHTLQTRKNTKLPPLFWAFKYCKTQAFILVWKLFSDFTIIWKEKKNERVLCCPCWVRRLASEASE